MQGEAGVDQVANVPPSEENVRRNEWLEADLERSGLEGRPAIGRSSNPLEPWSEHGFALIDVGHEQAVGPGRRYEQNSIFEWTPEHRALVLCRHPDSPQDEAVFVRGWRAVWRSPPGSEPKLSRPPCADLTEVRGFVVTTRRNGRGSGRVSPSPCPGAHLR